MNTYVIFNTRNPGCDTAARPRRFDIGLRAVLLAVIALAGGTAAAIPPVPPGYTQVFGSDFTSTTLSTVKQGSWNYRFNGTGSGYDWSNIPSFTTIPVAIQTLVNGGIPATGAGDSLDDFMRVAIVADTDVTGDAVKFTNIKDDPADSGTLASRLQAVVQLDPTINKLFYRFKFKLPAATRDAIKNAPSGRWWDFSEFHNNVGPETPNAHSYRLSFYFQYSSSFANPSQWVVRARLWNDTTNAFKWPANIDTPIENIWANTNDAWDTWHTFTAQVEATGPGDTQGTVKAWINDYQICNQVNMPLGLPWANLHIFKSYVSSVTMTGTPIDFYFGDLKIYRGDTVSSNPVAHWALDETSGTSAADSSGNGNTGTLTNMSAPGTLGQVDRAFEFDGVDDHVNAGSGTKLDNIGAVTVAAWINPNSMGEGGFGRIVQKGSGASPTSGWRFTIAGNGALGFAVDHTTDLIRQSVDGVAPIGTWKHVVATWDGRDVANGVRMYVNGAEVAYNTFTDAAGVRGNDSATNLYVGGNDSTDRSFWGKLDDVRVYHRVLSDAEITTLFQAGSLRAHWKLNETSGSAADSSGNGNNGTLTGPLWTSGQWSGGLFFDGTASPAAGDDIVDAGDGASLDNLPAVTVVAWIRPTSVGEGNFGRIVQKGSGPHPTAGWRFVVQNNNVLSFGADHAETDLIRASADGVLVPNTWQHVVVTWTGSPTATSARLYRNGAEVTYAVPAPTNGAGARNDDSDFHLYLGNEDTLSRTFGGSLDDVRIYNRVLSLSEIQSIYSSGGN